MKMNQLTEMFLDYCKTIDPPFVFDESTRDIVNFVSVKRGLPSGRWQFMALFFRPEKNVFYLEAALSPKEKFPAGFFHFSHEEEEDDGILRFRADSLWSGGEEHVGWLVNDDNLPPDATMYRALFYADHMRREGRGPLKEGVFNSIEEAMEALKERISGWVLPFFAQQKYEIDSVSGLNKRTSP